MTDDHERAVHVYRDKAGEWRWHVKAGNGKVIADSGEGYHNKGDCTESAEQLFPELPLVFDDA